MKIKFKNLKFHFLKVNHVNKKLLKKLKKLILLFKSELCELKIIKKKLKKIINFTF